MSQPNFIQIGQVDRQQDIKKDWQIVINNGKIREFFLKNWINVIILVLVFYIFSQRHVYFSIGNSSELQNGKALQVALKQKNIKQNVKNKAIAAIGDAIQPAHDPSDYKVIGGTEGVVELLPLRDATSKSEITSTASKKSGNAANIFDNVSIFIAPEKANPVVVKSKQEKCWDYVRRFIEVAKAERQKFGIPVSITLAQGLLESDAGESRLTQKANNHFGVKTFNRSVPHVVMKDDTPNDKFKKYDSAWESFRDHSLLLMRDHYKELQYLSKTDYVGWAQGLQKAGYATDHQYAEKLVKIIENLKLYKFDEA